MPSTDKPHASSSKEARRNTRLHIKSSPTATAAAPWPPMRSRSTCRCSRPRRGTRPCSHRRTCKWQQDPRQLPCPLMCHHHHPQVLNINLAYCELHGNTQCKTPCATHARHASPSCLTIMFDLVMFFTCGMTLTCPLFLAGVSLKPPRVMGLPGQVIVGYEVVQVSRSVALRA